ncbi:hydrolase [Halocatena salina]|uniref:Hydrolase n=1 Tax=Halocatena salina TaxID=2934340 RepID=A0A8U0A8I2_9EURY|nr:hydrolase [Halocatena salina]UPM44798.1 hydrolase [Halocatena salina]
MTNATATPSERLLTRENCAITFIDHQPEMVLGVNTIETGALQNNVGGLAKTADVYDIPVVLSTIGREHNGPLFEEIRDVLSDETVIDRTSMNSWENEAYVEAVEATGRDRLVMAGLWTEVCVCFAALSALDAGYDVYVVADACGGRTAADHEHALERMVNAGATPVTWAQVLYEIQRDWADDGAREAHQISIDHAGDFGMAVQYGDFLEE